MYSYHVLEKKGLNVNIKRNINNGAYDPEFVSLDRLKTVYGTWQIILFRYN